MDFNQMQVSQGYKYLLVVKHTFIGWIKGFPTPIEKAEEVVKNKNKKLPHKRQFQFKQFNQSKKKKKEDLGLVPGLGRSPGEGNGNPLQFCCLENAKDRGAWWATVHGVAKS